MSATVKGILQKINFIETDMELQKQILVSIPSKDKDQIEAVAQKIAEQKAQIQELRLKIKAIDPDEYNKIISIENATREFQAMAASKNFVLVNTLNETGECYITLNDDTRIDCLVAAKEDNGNWMVMTMDGEVKEFPSGIMK